MKKRILSMVLTLCMTLTLLPTTEVAAKDKDDNFSDTNVTWIGKQSEYQKTIDNMFVNGMRKMKEQSKWGIVDAVGEWVAPPIYDEIKLHYLVGRNSITKKPDVVLSDALEMIFVDGYTQCVRGGKMGLLNQYGEEAIPAKYDAVGLPSEGICRIVKKSGNTSYLGYWSLDLGRELVPPNKYVVSGANATAEGKQLTRQMIDKSSVLTGVGGSSDSDTGAMSIDYKEVSLPGSDRLAAQHDYMDGYTFVTTGKTQGACQYGTILNKKGKAILPGGPYLFRSGIYPQYGPYMVYSKLSSKAYKSDHGSLGRVYQSGVVGPTGIIIPAQYTGGVRSPARGWMVGDARIEVIPQLKLVVTAKDTKPGKENGGKVGVVNFKNKTVIPFTHDYNYFTYNDKHRTFGGYTNAGARLYTAKGKRLNNSNYSAVGDELNFRMINGFSAVQTFQYSTANGKYTTKYTNGFVNLKTGKEIFPKLGEAKGTALPYSDFSKKGTVWVKNPANKWGLLDGKGKVILPYKYDAVNTGDHWIRQKNAYAIVNIGHKQGIVSSSGTQILKCDYESISAPLSNGPSHPEYVEVTKNEKKGLYSIITRKFVIPCNYLDIIGYGGGNTLREYFSLGVNPVKTGKKSYALVDKNGKIIKGSNYDNIYAPSRGLFYLMDSNIIGAEGKIILPETLTYSGRKNSVVDDTTLVVKDGKVGYINAKNLAKPKKAKALNPTKAAASAASSILIVDGKSKPADLYKIGDNYYIKISDLTNALKDTDKKDIVIKTKNNDTGKGDKKSAVRSSSPIYMNGLQRNFTGYSIGSYTFYNLRDMMRAMNISLNVTAQTITLNTATGYELTKTEEENMIPAPVKADAPPAAQVNKLEIIKTPNLEFYMTGNHTFTTKGFELRYWDEKGVPHIITDTNEMKFTVEGKVIKDGYVFTVSSMKSGTVSYKGLTAPLRFPVYKGTPPVNIDNGSGATNKQLAEGKYTISCFGKKIGMSNGWMVIDSKKPVVFGVEKKGDAYYIFIEDVTSNRYIGVSSINHQLITNAKTKWTIKNLGGNEYSVRVYDNPKQLVNASGQQSKDGTPIIVYDSVDTPQNGKLTFTKAK